MWAGCQTTSLSYLPKCEASWKWWARVIGCTQITDMNLGIVEFCKTKVWLTIFPHWRERNCHDKFRGTETEDRNAPFLKLAVWKTITVTVVAGTEGTLFNGQGEAQRADGEVKERFPTSTKRAQSLTHTPLQDFLLLHHTTEGRKCSKHTGLSARLGNSVWRITSEKLANP